jgi:hypothetical protein
MNNTTSLLEFAERAFGIDLMSLPINSEKDVSNFNIEVLSYENNKNIFKQVNKIFRKEDSAAYILTSEGLSFIGSGQHRVAAKILDQPSWNYWSFEDLVQAKKSFMVLTEHGWQRAHLDKTKKKIPIFDIEVQDTHCYFTGGVLSHNSWAPHGVVPKTTSGGQALKFAATIRIEVKKKELEMDKDGEAVSQLIRLKTVKNKVAPPFRIREIRIRFGQGIEMDRDWFDYAVTFGVIVRRGGGHTFPSVNGTDTQHKEPSGEKAWEYFKSLSVFDRSNIIQATKDAMAAVKSTPTVITTETVESGVQKATRVTEEDDASIEEGVDAARED